MENSDDRSSATFCIAFLIPANAGLDVREVCRATEYLGGIPTGDKFAFPNAQRRDEALKLLRDKYGTSYFAAIETDADEEHVEADS